MLGDRLLRLAPARGQPVGDRKQRDVDLDGLGRAQVAIQGAPRQRPLVDEEAQAQVVARQRGDVGLELLARAQAGEDRARQVGARAVVADERRRCRRRGARAWRAWRRRAAARRSAARSARSTSSASGSASTARTARRAPARTWRRGRPAGRSPARAPRSCARRRRRGGSGSARRRAARAARAGSPRSGRGRP